MLCPGWVDQATGRLFSVASHVCAVSGTCLGCGFWLGPMGVADPGEPQWGLAMSEWRAGDGGFPVTAEAPVGPREQRRALLRGCSRKFCGSLHVLGVSRFTVHKSHALPQWKLSSGRKPGANWSLGLTCPRTTVTHSCLVAAAQRVSDPTAQGGPRTPGWPRWPLPVARPFHPLEVWAFSSRMHPVCGGGSLCWPWCRGEGTSLTGHPGPLHASMLPAPAPNLPPGGSRGLAEGVLAAVDLTPPRPWGSYGVWRGRQGNQRRLPGKSHTHGAFGGPRAAECHRGVGDLAGQCGEDPAPFRSTQSDLRVHCPPPPAAMPSTEGP